MVESGVQWSFNLVILDLQDQNSTAKLNFVVPVVFPRYQVATFFLIASARHRFRFICSRCHAACYIFSEIAIYTSDSAKTDQCYFPVI